MPKHKKTDSGHRSKIISMYAKAVTTGDIKTHVKDVCGIEMSDSSISQVTD
ncbi:transposase [Eubacteriaceae bacterium ES2]|nr:transposase [Eubacteriaceae bacterium ES2]